MQDYLIGFSEFRPYNLKLLFYKLMPGLKYERKLLLNCVTQTKCKKYFDSVMLRSGVEYVVNVFTNFSVISRHEHRHYKSETVNNEIVHNKFKGLNYFTFAFYLFCVCLFNLNTCQVKISAVIFSSTLQRCVHISPYNLKSSSTIVSHPMVKLYHTTTTS